MSLLDLLIPSAYARDTGKLSGIFGNGRVLQFLSIVLTFWFLLLQPQQQADKTLEAQLDELKRNDRVVTSRGILTTVTRMCDSARVRALRANLRAARNRHRRLRSQVGQRCQAGGEGFRSAGLARVGASVAGGTGSRGRAVALLVVLALCACGLQSSLNPLATLPASPATVRADPVSAAEPVAAENGDAAVPDGRYAGLAILTAFHGDCNAGGTGEIVVHGRTLSYHDEINPRLSGLLSDQGEVDLMSGSTHLIGRFVSKMFTGRIAGGVCEYQMRFERVAG